MKKEISKPNNNNNLKNIQQEINDYVRTGDELILKRILFKLYITQSATISFEKQKALTVMLMMFSDENTNAYITLE